MAKLSKQFSSELIADFVKVRREDIFQYFVRELTEFKTQTERERIAKAFNTSQQYYHAPMVPMPPMYSGAMQSPYMQAPYSARYGRPTIVADSASEKAKSKIDEIGLKIRLKACELAVYCLEMLDLVEEEQSVTKATDGPTGSWVEFDNRPRSEQTEVPQGWIKPRYFSSGSDSVNRDIESSQADDTAVIDHADPIAKLRSYVECYNERLSCDIFDLNKWPSSTIASHLDGIRNIIRNIGIMVGQLDVVAAKSLFGVEVNAEQLTDARIGFMNKSNMTAAAISEAIADMTPGALRAVSQELNALRHYMTENFHFADQSAM